MHDEQGIPNFSRLQKRGRLTRSIDIQRATVDLPASLYAFDLLAFDGYDLRPLKLEQRKHMLQQVLPTIGPVRYSDHISEHGEAMFEQMGAMGLEGVVGKRADSRYEAGRSSNWIKISVEKSDEFVVVGYTDPKIGKTGFGALLLGQYEDGVLVYSGRVGSGFKTQDLTVLGAELRDAEPATPPRDAPADKQMHWVAPECVCEVKYKEITPDGFPRHPVFLGLRDDKAPDECVRKIRAAPEPLSPVPAPVDKHVAFTNLDKVFWPAEGYTKGDLIDYYRGIAEWMLPYLQDRPVVLTRFPDGIDGKSFFQRDAPGFVPDWIRIETMWSENAEREVRYFIVDDAESLAYIANMGTIPLHVWSSRVATLEQPDWCILDLDPKEAPFEHVVKIAKAIRVLAEDIELPAFVKTSGSTGLHVLIPLGRQFTYEQCRSLGELLARVIVTELPEIATVTRSPAHREGKVYVDYLQNGHGRLLVAPFSVRPLPGAPVSMPIRWPELNARLSNERFHINNARRRMQSLKKHPLAELLALKPDLNAALQRLGERFG
ncbi:MAG: DNA ligase D [Proteobacteria bacterium]|nr:DNA ligase D [Pseudomonadota bacterium]